MRISPEVINLKNRANYLASSIGCAALAGTTIGLEVGFLKDQIETGALTMLISSPALIMLTALSINKFDKFIN